MSNLETFVAGYVEAILWANAYTENDETGEIESVDALFYDENDYSESVETEDAKAFYSDNLETLTEVHETYAQAWEYMGHDFALTRNGHGAGFWDRGHGALGEKLSEAARVYGEASVYIQ